MALGDICPANWIRLKHVLYLQPYRNSPELITSVCVALSPERHTALHKPTTGRQMESFHKEACKWMTTNVRIVALTPYRQAPTELGAFGLRSERALVLLGVECS